MPDTLSEGDRALVTKTASKLFSHSIQGNNNP